MRGDRAADGVVFVDGLSTEEREALLDDHGDPGGRQYRRFSGSRYRCRSRKWQFGYSRRGRGAVVRTPRLARIVGPGQAAQRRRLRRQPIIFGLDPRGPDLSRIGSGRIAERRRQLRGFFGCARGKGQQQADRHNARGMTAEEVWRAATTRRTHLETPFTQQSNRTDEASLCRNEVNGRLNGVRIADAARPSLARPASDRPELPWPEFRAPSGDRL